MAFVSFQSINCSKIAPKELFMLEWSENQKCYHIAPMLDQLAINFTARMNHKALDYIPIAIGDDWDELQRFAQKLDKQVPRYKEDIPYYGGDPE